LQSPITMTTYFLSPFTIILLDSRWNRKHRNK
jgi:hypothetical protein